MPHHALVKKLLLLCAVVLAIASLSSAALASTTNVGLSAIVVNGLHREMNGTSSVSAVPAPVLWISHRTGRFTLFGEVTSSLGPTPVSNTGNGFGTGLSSVQLSYLNVLLRYHLNARTEIGLGETVYNQRSTYSNPFSTLPPQIDTSRVVGMRYEIRERLYGTMHSNLTTHLAFNPHLSANLIESQSDGDGDHGDPGISEPIVTTQPEAGSQIDAALTNSVQNKRYTVSYGLRYVNMQMFFQSGELADRNSFVMPFIGVSTTVGR